MDSTQTDSLVRASTGADDDTWTLTLVHHPEADFIGVREPLAAGGRAVFGRAPQCVFPGALEMKSISREHLRLEHQGTSVELSDLNSHNGTYLNGVRTTRATVESGDIIGLGDVLVMVHLTPRAYREPEHASLLGTSWRLATMLDHIATFADDPENILLVGETGTGKELVAAALHAQSGRKGKLVSVNCGAFAEGVLHSELFGHKKGAFSGAVADNPGLIAAAADGSLFLDEVASAPQELQSSLLRVLENREYRMVGDTTTVTTNARFIAAIHPRDVPTEGDGSLRADLWYRLSRRRIDIPALRDRREDIMVLAHHFARKCRGEPVRFSRRFALALLQHDFPGNVRELVAVVEQAVLTQRGDIVEDPPWPTPSKRPAEEPKTGMRRKRQPRPSREDLVARLEKHAGSVAAVAGELGVNRKTLYRWLEGLAIDANDFRDNT